MNIIETMILDLSDRLKKANTSQRFGLHMKLRKYVEMANADGETYYCSTCGDKFTTLQQRNNHSSDGHGEDYI